VFDDQGQMVAGLQQRPAPLGHRAVPDRELVHRSRGERARPRRPWSRGSGPRAHLWTPGPASADQASPDPAATTPATTSSTSPRPPPPPPRSAADHHPDRHRPPAAHDPHDEARTTRPRYGNTSGYSCHGRADHHVPTM